MQDALPLSQPTGLSSLNAAALMAGYARGSLTPAGVLDAILARMAECEPVINAMAALDEEGARRAAAASVRRWAEGAPLSPLDGVPVSVKDNLHVAGLATRWGSRLLEGFVAPNDEMPVARLRAAGAVILGKTNTPEFAMRGTTDNLVSGTTRNPWDPALTPGGSSGGAAAAVAAGYGPLALATDGGGSIRRPASYCGLVGFKPSAGVVPRGGGLPEIFLGHEVVGGLGRTVDDVARLLRILSRPDLREAPSRPARILYVPRFGRHPVDPSIAADVSRAARDFEALGHIVEEASTFDLAEEVNALWPTLSAAGLAWMLRDPGRWPELRRFGPSLDRSLLGDAARATLADGEALPATALFAVFHAVEDLRRRLDEVFAMHDVLLTPAVAALPWPVEEAHPSRIAGVEVGGRGHAVFTALANAAGLPAITVSSGRIGRLPTGIQLVGRAGADNALIALARAYERNRLP